MLLNLAVYLTFMIEKIRQLVKKEAEEDDWKFHIYPMVNYSKKLAKILNANKEVTELAALLHDIGRIRFSGEGHEITGSSEAEKILKQHGYSPDVINRVKHRIQAHRVGNGKTLEARIISNADAMAHFDNIFIFFYWQSKKGKSYGEILQWVSDKINRDWNKKITLPEAREMMKDKYIAIKLILNGSA